MPEDIAQLPRRVVFQQARTALILMASLFVLFYIIEKLGYGEQKPQYLFTIGLTPMVSGAYLGIALMYVTLPFRDLELFVTAVLAILLEGFIFERRPFTWDMATRFGAIGVGIGVACWLAMAFRIATAKGSLREQAQGYLCVASILPLFPKVSSWMHYLVIHETRVIYDQYGYALDGLLGFQPPILMARFFNSYPWVHDLSMFVYNKLPLWMVVATLFWLNRPSRVYFNPMMVMVTIAPCCMLIYSVLPMVGITLMFADYPPQVPPLITHPTGIPMELTAPVSCMPSMHATWIFIIFLAMAPHGHIWLMFSGFLVFFTLMATLGPEAGHYFIDLVMALPFLLFFVALFLNRMPCNQMWKRYSLAFGCGSFFFSLYLIKYQIQLLVDHGFLTIAYFAWMATVCLFLHWKMAVVTLERQSRP